jgi:hypothetical protein
LPAQDKSRYRIRGSILTVLVKDALGGGALIPVSTEYRYGGMGLKREPDFSRLRKVLLREGEPDVVPFYELFADQEVISKVLGRPYQGLKDRIEFQCQLGYDFVCLFLNIPLPMHGQASTSDTAELSKG